MDYVLQITFQNITEGRLHNLFHQNCLIMHHHEACAKLIHALLSIREPFIEFISYSFSRVNVTGILEKKLK